MLTWSQTRLLVTLAIAGLIMMEPVSWLTSPIPPCIVNLENYGSYYATHHECPTFHVFLIVTAAPVFEHFGDPNWVIADFTVVLAISTIGLWVATARTAKIAERALTEHERPWLFLEGATVSRRELPGQALIPNNFFIA